MLHERWRPVFKMNYPAIGIFLGLVLLVSYTFRDHRPQYAEHAAVTIPSSDRRPMRVASHREMPKIEDEASKAKHEEPQQGASPQKTAGANLVLKLLLMAHGKSGSSL